MLQALNQTFIALILKGEMGVRISDYRPIALCNVIDKITIKVMAEHLKPLLDSIICPEQGGFVEGRQILHGMVLAQEAIHSMQEPGNRVMFIKWISQRLKG